MLKFKKTNFPNYLSMLFLAAILVSCSKPGGVRILKLGHGLDTSHPVHAAMLYLAEKAEIKILGQPYLFRDDEQQAKVLEGPIGKQLLAAGEKYWLKGLCFYDGGKRSFYTKDKPVMVPSDIEGLKIRVMESPTAVNMVQSFGGSPTPVSFGELYTALQQGIVDGAENNPPSFVTSRHYEVCKYYSLIDENFGRSWRRGTLSR